MSWLKLDLDVVAAEADEVGDLLLSLGALCVSMGPGSEDVVLEPAPGAAPLWRCTRISALLPLDADLAAVRANVESQVRGCNFDMTFDVNFVEDADWLTSWRANAVYRCFGDRLWVVPRDVEPPSGVCLRINPATRENAAYNQVTAAQLIVQDPADLSADGGFDVVVANILANPLLELASLFMTLLRPGGSLVLSGLLAHQEDRVVKGYPQLRFEAPTQTGSWLRLSGVKPKTQQP